MVSRPSNPGDTETRVFSTVTLASLWLPIVLSAVAIFFASSVIHMVLKYHQPEYRKLPDEDAVRAAFNRSPLEPGQYVIPHCADSKAMASPEMQKKYVDGPIAAIWVGPRGPISLGPHLLRWFLYTLVVCTLCAYLATVVMPNPGMGFMHVVRVVGTAAFLAFAMAHWSNVVWKHQPVRAALLDTLDGLIYGLLTGVVFAALWPR